jgi:hypothetical protein
VLTWLKSVLFGEERPRRITPRSTAANPEPSPRNDAPAEADATPVAVRPDVPATLVDDSIANPRDMGMKLTVAASIERSNDPHHPMFQAPGTGDAAETDDFVKTINGYELQVRLQQQTPLEYLMRFRERVPPMKRYDLPFVNPDFAYWQVMPKSWAEIVGPRGAEMDQAYPRYSPQEIYTDIGPMPLDGAYYLPFLIGFRRIIERDAPTKDRLAEIAIYLARPECAEVVKRSKPDLATRWAVQLIDNALPIGEVTAQRIFDAGFVDVASIRAAPDSELRKISGLGPKRLAAIRSVIGSAP